MGACWHSLPSIEFGDLARHNIDCVEFPSAGLDKTEAFFVAAFGCKFGDFGSDYTAFSGAGLNGGFFAADCAS